MAETILKTIETERFLDEFAKLKESNEQKRSYSMNIIDELHANENAHTRILIKLLSFVANNGFPIFEKFLSLLNEQLDENFKIKTFNKPKFEGQFGYIDAYIYNEEKTQAIIIENKIDWASDQNKQIERYIEVAKAHKIPEANIYVVYLTDDGRKKVSAHSLTPTARKWLGMEESSNEADASKTNGRYIEMNYKEHILPLLKDVLSYLDFSKEIYLKSAIVQYIDYLDGRFGLRERDKNYLDSMISGLRKILKIEDENIKTIRQKEEVFNEINEFRERLQTTIKNKSSAESDLTQDIDSYFNALCNLIYPEEIQPRIVARSVLFTFANREKQIIFDGTPFTKAQIFWQNHDLLNRVFFDIYETPSTLTIRFTPEKIEFQINYKNDILVPFFEKYEAIAFKQSKPAQSDYNRPIVFEISYEEHYSKIIDELKTFFIEMNRFLAESEK